MPGDDETADRGDWVERAVGRRGLTERLGYLSPEVPDLFVRLLRPREPRGVVVICPNISAGRSRWAEREERLARRLAARGMAAATFDYRGEGRSPRAGEPGLAAMHRDVSAALDVARDPDLPEAVVAIGIAGPVALPETERRGLPVALWAVATSGESFFFELMREQVVRQMGFQVRSPGEAELLDRVAADLLHEELDRDGVADLGGNPLERPLYESLAGVTLQETSDRTARFDADVPAEVVSQWVETAIGAG